MRTGKFSRTTFTLMLSLGAIWFLIRTALYLFGYQLEIVPGDLDVGTFLTLMTVGLVLLIASGMSYAYNRIRTKGGKRAGWLR